MVDSLHKEQFSHPRPQFDEEVDGWFPGPRVRSLTHCDLGEWSVYPSGPGVEGPYDTPV